MKTRKKVQVCLCHTDTQQNKWICLFLLNKDRGGHWQNITGGVDEGESFIQAAQRECEEESSLKLSQSLFIQSQLQFEFKDRWGYQVQEQTFYVKLDKKYDIKHDLSEHQSSQWFLVDDALKQELRFDSHRQLINEAIR